MTMTDYFFYYGIIFITVSIYGFIKYFRQKDVDVSMNIFDTEHAKREGMRVLKEQKISIADMVFGGLGFIWTIGGLFTDEKILFLLLLLSSLLVPILQMTKFKKDTMEINVKTSKTMNVVSTSFEIIITIYILYHHFYVNTIL